MKEIPHISDLTFNISSLVSNAPWHYAARAFLLNKSNHLALSHEKVTGLYALVGGTMEIDETPQQCLLRELKEETGCDCQIQAPLGIITENRGLLDYRKKSFFYTASVLSAGIAKQTQEEKMLQQEILWLPINDSYDIIQKQIYNSIQYQFIQKRDILAFEEFFLKLNSI